MKKPPGVVEVFLQPGEYYWGDRYNRLRTILGSCVTLTAWHPQLQVGGMTHIMMPEKGMNTPDDLNAKYAEDAIAMLLADMRKCDQALAQYQLKLFGGGQMFNPAEQRKSRLATLDIGARNLQVTKQLLSKHALKTHAEHIGGMGHRSLMFDVWNGYVWLKHVQISA